MDLQHTFPSLLKITVENSVLDIKEACRYPWPSKRSLPNKETADIHFLLTLIDKQSKIIEELGALLNRQH